MSKRRSIYIKDEHLIVDDWLGAQNNVSLSLHLVITKIIEQYGQGDLMTAMLSQLPLNVRLDTVHQPVHMQSQPVMPQPVQQVAPPVQPPPTPVVESTPPPTPIPPVEPPYVAQEVSHTPPVEVETPPMDVQPVQEPVYTSPPLPQEGLLPKPLQMNANTSGNGRKNALKQRFSKQIQNNEE